MLQNILAETSLQTPVVYIFSITTPDVPRQKLHYVIIDFMQQI